MSNVTVQLLKNLGSSRSLLGALVLSLLAPQSLFAAAEKINASSLKTNTISLEETAPKKFNGSWNFALSNSQYRDEFNQKNMTATSVGVDLTYDLTRVLQLKFNPRFAFETGYLQTETQSDSSYSAWTTKEASVNLTPVEYVELSAGALNQSALHSRLLLADIAFPAVRLTLQTAENQNLRFGFKAQSAIATSSSLSTETNELEKTPSFQSAGLFTQGQWRRFKFGLRANYFQFKNLPTSLATVSGVLGNTVNSTSNDMSEFAYEYKGYEVNGNSKILVGRFSYEIKAAFVKNTVVEKELSEGFRVENSLAMKVHPEWSMAPSYEYFKIAPDAAVAAYNSSSLTANRVGYRAGFSAEMLKIFKASIKAGQRSVVYVSPSQSREKTLDLELETMNVPF